MPPGGRSASPALEDGAPGVAGHTRMSTSVRCREQVTAERRMDTSTLPTTALVTCQPCRSCRQERELRDAGLGYTLSAVLAPCLLHDVLLCLRTDS